MTPETVIDILREALWLIVLLSAVIIGPGLVVGLVVSTFQAATQINETISIAYKNYLSNLATIWPPSF